MAMSSADAWLDEKKSPASELALICNEGQIKQTFHYWRGASGRRYLHSAYSLLECPVMPKANYILVGRDANGNRTPLEIGQTLDNACSLNLAYLRQKGAQLGANEIHIHVLTETERERCLIEADLRAALFGHSVTEQKIVSAANTAC